MTKFMKKALACFAVVCMLASMVMPTFAVMQTSKTDKLMDKAASYATAAGSRVMKAAHTYILGDVTLDEELNTGDAVMVLRFVVGALTFDDLQMQVGNANRDADVNTGDAVYILRVCVGLENEETIEIDDGMPEVEKNTVEYFDGVEDAEIVVPTAAEVEVGSTYTVSAEVPVRENYTFRGWVSNIEDELNMGEFLVYRANDTFVMPAFDVTLTATWVEGTVETHTVTYFDGVDEEEIVVPAVDEVEVDATYEISMDVPTRENYTFIGWLSNISESSLHTVKGPAKYVVFQAAESFTMPYFDVTLTATWEENTTPPVGNATVNVVLNDTFNGVNSTITYELTLTETTTLNESNINLPEGYLFDGAQSKTVTVNGATATPATVSFNVYPCYTDSTNVKYKVITTNEGLESVRDNMEINYMLKNDIDNAGENFTPLGWTDGDDVRFTGIFDGNGFTIENFVCDWTLDEELISSNVGLFAYNEGTIKNITVSTVVYEDAEGGLYGVFGHYNVGGIVGKNDGTISGCTFMGNIGALDVDVWDDNGTYVSASRCGGGGITGNNSGTVSCCAVIGGVEGFYWIGGVVGKNFGTVDQSYFMGNINSAVSDEALEYYSIRYIGGICGGMQAATVSNSYVYCTDYIKGMKAVGGITGWVSGGTIKTSYLGGPGAVYAASDSGTVYGYYVTQPTVTNVYAIPGCTELPEGFEATIWDLNGESFITLPDLINNRRPADIDLD